MAFFTDLSPYTWVPYETPTTVNVGWLDLGEPFNIGVTSDEFRRRLQQICQRPERQTRGIHICCFCSRVYGSGEIRVIGLHRVYAAPELVHHYVEAHGYLPPDEFVAAVLAWKIESRGRVHNSWRSPLTASEVAEMPFVAKVKLLFPGQ